ncbi:Do family serine endopeptidase [Nisaea acidiphila]|uniref:Do family serine endopeptidase n=1 Tax=Nisaea acidiphila TaxID=1862145 RepID=A0A9J7AM13_9PROT|nr:Do family serine endopeptidase [Nisaea acidiphila]UUX48683.1 Do family serine endopeptidase [Nisaea acidiphila]
MALAAGIALTLLSFGPASAQTVRQVPASREDIQYSFAPLVRKVGPAVVNIYARAEVTERRISPLFDDPFFRRFFGDVFPGETRKRTAQSLGSGVIMREDGLVVTNAHVIKGADEITVVLADRREFDAKILIQDERTDLAVLRIETDGENLPYLQIRDSDELEVGDIVLAIGNPFGVGQTVTSGIISALARTALGITDYSFFIQTDAAINPGNSGGALISMDGRLVGVNTAIFSNQKGSGAGSVGIGFAVPSNMVRTILEGVDKGVIIRPWLGVSGQTMTTELAEQFGLPRPVGVAVTDVYPDGPAANAGIRVGDIVLKVSGREIVDEQALRYRVATRPLESIAEIEILRRGEIETVSVPMRPPLAQPAPDLRDLNGQHPLAGARVANLSPAFALENDLDDMARGVVVLKVARQSPAARIGLRPGDIVLEVNGEKIDLVATLERAMLSSQNAWRISIRREGQVLTTEIKS